MFFKILPFEVRLEILMELTSKEQLNTRLLDKQFAEDVRKLRLKTMTPAEKIALNNKLISTIVDYMITSDFSLESMINENTSNPEKSTKKAELLTKIDFLINFGADVNFLSEMDSTPLHLLTELGGDDVLYSFLVDKHKANTEAVNSQGLKTYETAPTKKNDLAFHPHAFVKKEQESKCAIM